MATTTSVPTTGKRARTPSHRSSSISSTASNSASPEAKISRSSTSPDGTDGNQGQQQQRPIQCILPPTCNRHPVTLANSKELERHYAMYHAHVCEQPGCGCVFPEARLLELHQTECHDPLAAVRKERGEKIFGCLLQTCPKSFLTPKARRLHMIEAHKYPKEFFFAVTNKGIGGLLKKWGEGASMIRGEWKPRDEDQTKKKDGKDKDKVEDSEVRMVEDNKDEEESSSEEEQQQEVDMEEVERTPRPLVRPLHPGSPPRAVPGTPNSKLAASKPDADVDALAEGMTSLSLVPPSIRFGRGGHGGALGMRGRARGMRGGIIPPYGGRGNHQRSTSEVVGAESESAAGRGSEGRRGRGARKHRVTTSVGSSMEMDTGGKEGGEVVVFPPTQAGTGGRGRGGRGRRGGRGTSAG